MTNIGRAHGGHGGHGGRPGHGGGHGWHGGHHGHGHGGGYRRPRWGGGAYGYGYGYGYPYYAYPDAYAYPEYYLAPAYPQVMPMPMPIPTPYLVPTLQAVPAPGDAPEAWSTDAAQPVQAGATLDLIGRRGGGAGWGWRGHGGGRRGWPGGGGRGFYYGGGWGGAGYPWAPYDWEYQWPGPAFPVVPFMVGAADGDLSSQDDQDAADPSDAGLREVLPVLAPGAAGISTEIDLRPDLHLDVSICVDGMCYTASADLSGVIGEILASTAGTSGPQAEQAATSPLAAETVAQQSDELAQVAGAMLVGALFDQHCWTVSAGWWSSLSHGISSAMRGVGSAAKATGRTLKKHRGSISKAAGIAAGAVATVYGGPAAGVVAAKLANSLVMSATGDHQQQAEAQQVLDQAQAAAATDPDVAKLLATAQKAAASVTAAYHVASTASAAEAGDARAQQAIVDLQASANRGDQAAQRGMLLLQEILQAAQASPQEQTKPQPQTQTSGTVGRSILSFRRDASVIAKRAHAQTRAPAMTVVLAADGRVAVTPAATLDDAIDWMDGLDRRAYAYAAAFDVGDPTWPSPQGESVGTPSRASGVRSAGAAYLPWFLLGAAGAGGLAWWHRHRRASSAAPAVVREAVARAQVAPPTVAPVATSGEVSDARAEAIVAVQEMRRASGGRADLLGFVKRRDGHRQVRDGGGVVTIEDTSQVLTFASFGEMAAWFDQAADSTDYVYIACFDATSSVWPAPIGSIATRGSDRVARLGARRVRSR